MAPRIKQEVIEIDVSEDDQVEKPNPGLRDCHEVPERQPSSVEALENNSPPAIESKQESLIESMINQCMSFHKKLSTYEPLMTSTQRSKWMKHLSSLRDCAALEAPSADAEEFRADYDSVVRPIRTRRVYKKKKRRTTRRVRGSANPRPTARKSSRPTIGVARSGSASVGSTATFQKAKQAATNWHSQMARAKAMSQSRVKVEPSGTSSVKVKKERI